MQPRSQRIAVSRPAIGRSRFAELMEQNWWGELASA
jgi:hypothetical protein